MRSSKLTKIAATAIFGLSIATAYPALAQTTTTPGGTGTTTEDTTTTPSQTGTTTYDTGDDMDWGWLGLLGLGGLAGLMGRKKEHHTEYRDVDRVTTPHR